MASTIAGLFLATILPFQAHAVDQAIGPFGGLDTNTAPEALDASHSPDLLNVDIEVGGKSAKKRQGYGLDATLFFSTSPVHNLYKFFDSSGNEVRLAFSDVKVNSSVNGSAWTVILTTGITTGATWDCTDYLGFAYCVSSAFDCPIKTNGTSAGTTGVCGTNAVPAGTLVSNSGDRLLIGATSANPSRLYYSASTVFTDFSLGVQPASSSFEDILAPGSKLTHLAYHFGRWLWWKDQSFGFIVGTGQFDLQLVTVSNSIGTLDNTDVFDGNLCFFRGSDAQIYTYDGSSLSRAISNDIAPTLRTANRRKANSWVQTTAADFGAGSGLSTFVDTTTFSGSVELLNYQEPFTSISPWTLTGQWAVIGNAFKDVSGWAGADRVIKKTVPFGSAPPGFYLHGSFAFLDDNSANNGQIVNFTFHTPALTGYGIKYAGGTTATLSAGRDANGSITADFSTAVSVTDSLYHTLDLIYSATGYAQVYMDGTRRGSFQNTTYTGMTTLAAYASTDSVGTSTPSINSFAVSAGTGSYYSAVNNAPNITSFNTLGVTDSLNGNSSITYYSRSSSNTFTLLSSTPAWVSQTKNATVAASSNTYFQLRGDFAVTAATETPTLSDFTFNWYEGTASDKMSGTYFNSGIWFSMSIGTTTATNNRIFRYDLLSNLWTLYDIPTNGFLTYNNNLYFGSPTVGKVFQFGNNVYSDNGTAISAYWKSKPFFGDSPFTDKDLRTASWYIESDSGTTLTLTYELNRTTNTVTKNISLSDSRRGVIQNNWNFPAGTSATTFSAKFSDNSSNPPWEVFGGLISFVPKPWIVSP